MPSMLSALVRSLTRCGLVVTVALAGMTLQTAPAHAVVSLTVTPVTWDVIGLDSNNVAVGPNLFPVGEKVCNTTSSAVSGVTALFQFDTANAYITLTSRPTVALGTIAANACVFAYYDVTIVRNANAYNSVRRYHVEISVNGVLTASSPVPRQLFVEHLLSQGRNSVASVTGQTVATPAVAIPATGVVYVGQQYKFTVNMATATQGYTQLFTPVNFPADIFRIDSFAAAYTAPTNGSSATPYSDGCNWGQDPSVAATYKQCNGASNTYVNHGGTITLTYLATVMGTGTGTLGAMVNDGSGSSFHYNADFGTSTDAMPFQAVVGPQLTLALTNNSPWSRSGSGAVTATVTNSGDYTTSAATTVGLTLPAGLTFTSSASVGWTCSAVAQQVTCTRAANVAVGTSSVVVVAVAVGATATSPLVVTGTADTAHSATASASTSPTVVQPLAVASLTSSGVGTAVQTVSVVTNAGDTVRLLDSSNNPATTVTVAGQGTYSMPSATSIAFAPVLGYTGTATPVTFRRTDTTSASGTATYTPTVTPPAPPAPPAKTSSGGFGTTQTTTLSIPTGGSVQLLDATSGAVTTVTNSSGTYTLNASTAVVTFVPAAGFYGTATAVTYRATDAYSQTGTNTYTPSVTAPPAPTPPALTSSGPLNTAQTATIAIPAGGSVTLLTAMNAPATSVVVTGGTYSLDISSGAVTFTPASAFTGTAPAVTYRVTDSAAQSGSNTYTPTVTNTAPAPPSPPALTSSGAYGADETASLTVPSGGSASLLTATNVPATTVTNASGSYTLTGTTVTFTPVSGFVGAATAVGYRITDAYAQQGDSTYTPTVSPPAPPFPAPVTSSGALNTAQSASLVIPSGGSVRLLDSGNLAATTVTNAAGQYVLNTSTGVVTFTPTSGFVGTAPSVGYRATDAYAQTGDSTYTPTVAPPAAPAPPAVTTIGAFNAVQTTTLGIPAGGTVRLLTPTNISATTVSNASGTYTLNVTNGVVTFTPSTDFVGTATAVSYRQRDVYGQYGDSTYTPTVNPPPPPAPVAQTSSGALDAVQQVTLSMPTGGSVRLLDASNAVVTTVTNGAGTYVLDATSGVVTFTPTSGVSGVAPSIAYRVTDFYSQSGDSTYTATVFPAGPAAPAKSTSGPLDTAQSVALPLPAGGSVSLLDSASTPVTTVTNSSGTYLLAPSGVVTFTPATGVSGVAPVVSYEVTDAYAQTATGGYTATVVAQPAPPAVTSSGPFGVAQQGTLAIPAGGSVSLLDAQGNTTSTLTTAAGSYVLNTSTGVVTFSPTAGVSGTAAAIGYRATDAYAQHGDSTYTATVDPAIPVVPGPPAPPTTSPLTSIGPMNAAQGVTVAIPSGDTVTLLDALNAPVTTVTNAAGTYTLNAGTGAVTFTPTGTFSGVAPAVSYAVTDVAAQSSTNTYTATVVAPPNATNVTSSAMSPVVQSTTVTIPAGGAVTLLTATGVPSTAVVVTGEGSYALDATTGTITFAPESSFLGQSGGVTYRLTDSYGQSAAASYTPTVTAVVPAPPAPPAPPAVTGITTAGPIGLTQQAPVTLPPGDSVTLLDAQGVATNSVTIPGEGTYVLDPASGVITFTGVPGFVGTATGVTFVVTDAAGTKTSAVYRATITASVGRGITASIVVRALVVLHRGDASLVPATCGLSAEVQVTCSVEFHATVDGHDEVIGRGSRTVSTARAGRTLRVSVVLTTLGRALAALPGGVRVTAWAKIWEPSGRLLTAKTRTRIVTSALALRPVFFATASSELRATDKIYLDGLRKQLGGVTSVRCSGYTDSRAGDAYNMSLARARADATCAYLLRGTHVRSVTSAYGETRPQATNVTVDGRARNRRAELMFIY